MQELLPLTLPGVGVNRAITLGTVLLRYQVAHIRTRRVSLFWTSGLLRLGGSFFVFIYIYILIIETFLQVKLEVRDCRG